MGGMQHFTFRPTPGGGYAEEALFRDTHPMMAKRLQLHRLQHFDLERLPSVEDVYVFRAVAKGNPRDERLVVVGAERAGVKIGCPEEASFCGGFLSLEQLMRLLETMPNCEYRAYLLEVVAEAKRLQSEK